jgi:hypothetical protein
LPALLWLISTNDNTHAIRFYQRRGSPAAVHVGAVDRYRRDLKPEIPRRGSDDIPIRDEVEFEMPIAELDRCHTAPFRPF